MCTRVRVLTWAELCRPLPHGRGSDQMLDLHEQLTAPKTPANGNRCALRSRRSRSRPCRTPSVGAVSRRCCPVERIGSPSRRQSSGAPKSWRALGSKRRTLFMWPPPRRSASMFFCPATTVSADGLLGLGKSFASTCEIRYCGCGRTLMHRTLDEIRRVGLTALRARLGRAGLIRFLQQFETGEGDYAVQRRDWVDRTTLSELEQRAAARGKRMPARKQSPRRLRKRT